MKLPEIPRLTDHGSEITLLGLIAIGVLVAMIIGMGQATAARAFDPSAYLVVETMIVSAIKERWTQRSVDRMGQSLANAPPSDPPASSGDA